MPKDVKRVAPDYVGTHNYTNENLGIVEPDYDNMRGGLCEEFRAGADIVDGVSGKKVIDTLYENTSQDMVDNPRSEQYADDFGTPPVPLDLHRYPHRRY